MTQIRSGENRPAELLYEADSYRILGACFEVYNEMGCGFLEAVYQECLELEFHDRALIFRSQSDLALSYKGRPLKQRHVPDFILFDKIVLELKAVKELTAEHRAQVHDYLRATSFRLGLLANFGHYPKLEYERIVI
ncbi:MAG TPA: GxxExxY protein [Pirellulales bacterium]|jgi:GxxExxY protein|nr:GxxExxY protein [Pirellulales bacterium]